jgi:hypothetical protein
MVEFDRSNRNRKRIHMCKTIRILVASGCLFLLAAHALGRLWDSEVEIEKHYGPCVGKIENDPVFGNLSVYHYREYEVRVTFMDGKSQSEYYINRDTKMPLTNEEIEFLLQLNASGRNWRKSSESPLWRLGDSEAFAVYRSEGAGGLGICTAKFLDWQQKQQTQDRTK